MMLCWMFAQFVRIHGTRKKMDIIELIVFDGRFAYQVPWSESFMEDVRNHSMKSVNQSRLYLNIINNKETED